ncbi:hypothetical protein [Synechococcus sp. RS9916]|uniref:hypothetical protein n=1 Tax=Synechococcus sp. RS9916 TaxID=221359 RepID=UPI0000E53997|nr:hypothetical protein [Synechococcus sp. RS9916]EAU74414.1 hypothetical protein RS9916_32942 [Synechococcus sp. RS9916]
MQNELVEQVIDCKTLINGLELKDAQDSGDTRGALKYARRIDLLLSHRRQTEGAND